MTDNQQNGPLHLQEELQDINRRFENGEMKAFGSNQARVLKEFQDIRISQAQLSMRQVSMGSEKMMNQGDNMNDFMESTSISDQGQTGGPNQTDSGKNKPDNETTETMSRCEVC